jgi:hypothetical protein
LQNNHYISLIVPALLTFAVLIGLAQVLGSPLQNAIVGITTYTLYALFFIIVYLMRFALLFLCLFAAYRIKQNRSSKQTSHQEKLQVFRSLSD